MWLEVVKAVAGLVFLVGDISLVVTCSALHFLRGEERSGSIQGAFTLGLFFVAGFITNVFHLFGHEWEILGQRDFWGKVKRGLLLVVPCSSLLLWYVGRCRNPKSLSRRCWTSSLRLFYCTGTFVQAVLQSYVVVHLWWEENLPQHCVYVPMVAAIFFSLHAIYGVCGYIWTAYYDETRNNLPALDYLLIIAALSLNMAGRVVAMSVVMGTLGWYWLALAVLSPLLINYTVYITQAPSATTEGAQKVWLYIFMLPLSFLSSISVSERRILTFITTMAWLGCFVPQIVAFHETLSEWLVWSVPSLGQVIALIIMMVRWSVFEAAFERFGRLARVNPFVHLPSKVTNSQETYTG